MEKYIKILTPNNVEEMKTNYKYELNEIITLNSKIPCKCVQISKEDNKTIYVFKASKIIYDYSW